MLFRPPAAHPLPGSYLGMELPMTVVHVCLCNSTRKAYCFLSPTTEMKWAKYYKAYYTEVARSMNEMSFKQEL